MSTPEEIQDQIWDKLYAQLVAHFSLQGIENGQGRGDFFVVDDN